VDLDEEISKREQKSIPQIFEDSGEIYFRKIESQVLQEIIKSPVNLVLSLGGGTPCYGKNLGLIKGNSDSRLVYLKVGLEELLRRLAAEKKGRPLISHLDSLEALENFVRKHLYERSFYYNQSDFIIDTDGKDVEESVAIILSKLK
jgi:shikimate kinase